MTVDSANAPWNRESLPGKEVEVTVSMTLSKTMKIMVDDYKVEEGEDNGDRFLYEDYSECDLYTAMKNQVTLPQELAEFTEDIFNHDLNLNTVKMPKFLKDSIEDCKDWSLDDLEIILE